MADTYKVKIALDVRNERAVAKAEKSYRDLKSVAADITAFLSEFGYADSGPQTITIVIESETA